MLIKITTVIILVYWILKIIYSVHLDMMDTEKKIRFRFGRYDKCDWIWIYAVAIMRILSWVMGFVTAFYLVFKFL